MAEMTEKALTLLISAVLLVAGFKAAQTTLFPLILTAAALAQYNSLADELRQQVSRADTVPMRSQFEVRLPSGVSIYSDGKSLIIEMDTQLGRRTERIPSSLKVEVQRSIDYGIALVVVDSTQGEIQVKIGGA
jgi:hypothetical protein